jgi:hypothetical protein
LIKKPRTKPIKLLKLEAILNRMPLEHPKRHEIQIEFAKNNAGYKGELSLDYYLADLPSENYHIYHDLRLPRNKEKKYYFQIDCLVVHPRFCLLLEVKNLIGNLYFDHQYDQVLRTRDGVEETFSDPINQVEAQKEYFKKWLAKNKLPNVPLHTLVVITNPKSYIRISPQYGKNSKKIIRGNNLVTRIKDYSNQKVEDILFKRELRKFSTQLSKEHTILDSNILQTYALEPNDLLPGVACPFCKKLPMIRTYGNWFCPNCLKKSNDAHIQALNDYALLFGIHVTNKTLREYLHIESRSSVKKLMISMNLPPNGHTKAATYTLPLPK